MSPSPSLFVYVTHPGHEEAVQLARDCLEQRLIACANIFPPVASLYRWEGKICQDREWVLILKTDEHHFSRLAELIQHQHPAENPCIMALPIAAGSAQYEHWLRSCLSE